MRQHAERLSKEMFDGWPVWADDEYDEGFEQVDPYDPLPTDRDVYVKANLITPQGRAIPGCVRTDGVFAAMFVGDNVYPLNALLAVSDDETKALRDELGIDHDAPVFPVRFQTPFRLATEGTFGGVFQPGDLQ
jgi:hypothetical protein